MTIQDINNSIDEGEALKTIATAYTEITSVRLKRIREQVIRTRAFFVEVLNIYAMLRQLNIKKQPALIDKTASLILTSNNRFYGHIESELIKFFLTQTKKGDIFVVGKGGREAFKTLGIPFKSVIFKQDVPEPMELIDLVAKVKNYRSILVYFARFQTVLSQTPVMVDITQSQSRAALASEKIEGSYIFEPEIPKIVEFFDNQLKQVLIEQTFLETELARTSSKLISMDQAQNNADEFLKKQHKLLIHAKRSLQNTEILEIAGSMFKIDLGL